MVVVQVLSDHSMGLDSAICIYFGHIHVIDEIYKSFASRWTIVSPGFFLQRFLQKFLKHL